MPRSRSPSLKRIKLEGSSPTLSTKHSGDHDEDGDELESPDEDAENNCSICLQATVNRTVVPKCSHEFCFECLLVWTEQSRRCPLCSQAIGDYLIHSIRSRYDYRKHFLSPLRTSPPPIRPAQNIAILRTTRQHTRRQRRDRAWGTRDGGDKADEESDKLERSIVKRRWLYQHDLYAKHVASNSFTKYRPYPSPAQFAASQELISRTTTFLRRELQVWEGLDVEFLTTLIVSLMKAIDIRSESAVKLISEFLDMDEPYTPGGRHRNAEHFAHEVYSYVRSPYKDLFIYDSVVQYDTPEGVPPPLNLEQSRRWQPPSPSRAHRESSNSPERHQERRDRSASSERQMSWSPSGRRYSPLPIAIEVSIPGGAMGRRRDSQASGSGRQRTSRSERPSTNVAPLFNGNSKGKQKDGGSHTQSESVPSRLKNTPAPINSLLPEEVQEPPPNASNSTLLTRARKPRNQSLVDSVKEHLSRNPDPTATAVTLLAGQPRVHEISSSSNLPIAPSLSGFGSPPTLLLRMSGPFTSSAAFPPSSTQSSSGMTTPSVPGIATSSCSSVSFDTGTHMASQILPMAAEGKGKAVEISQSSSNSKEEALSTMEARAKLLARLNREKRKAQAPAQEMSGVNMMPPSEDSSMEGTMPLYEQRGAEAREASLRIRAQLRVRLAAEKLGLAAAADQQ